MQNIVAAYTELCDLLKTKIPGLKWIDLWHNQVNFLSEEHPFPTPAIFLSFRTLNTEDRGMHVQDADTQVDVYLFYETMADTFKGSYNQQSALAFLQMLNDVHALLHGYSGTNLSEMRHTGFSPVDTGGAGNLYRKSFACNMRDYNANNDGEMVTEPEPEDNLFNI
ncbi:MAG: hypothetical protein U0T77_10665 [Chitinophagales bacterium]